MEVLGAASEERLAVPGPPPAGEATATATATAAATTATAAAPPYGTGAAPESSPGGRVQRRRRWPWRVFPSLVVLAVLAAGLAGAYQYIWTFWLYRGFPPPQLPAALRGSARAGLVEQIQVRSSAAGPSGPVLVYLPPGYFTHPWLRYPSLYLLHGVPGEPGQFVDIADVQVVEARLVAEHRMRPTVLVMPAGAAGLLSDTEWANSRQPGADWMTYVATDVVGAVDRRFRVLRRGASRGIAGLSEGGYGALNIALHHPREFRMVESWSGYMQASPSPRLFGSSAAVLTANSPAAEAARERAALLAEHSYLWFYCGRSDYELGQNVRFAAELQRLGLPHTFFIHPGRHDWKLWRSLMARALVVASEHLGGARQ